MRVIAYVPSVEEPTIQHVENISDIRFTGGEILDGGWSVALHCVNDTVVVLPVGELPGTLDEAMEARSDEIFANRGNLAEIYRKKKRQKDASVAQAIWALGLDPEDDYDAG